MSGKGSNARPFSICGTEYDERWNATFGTKHETRTVPCDRCNGTGVIHDMPMDIVGLTTFDVQSRACPSCLGQGHAQENVE